MSWESSAEYYRLANELVKDRLGGLHSARLLLASVDFAEVEHLQVTGQWEEAGRILAGIAKRLEIAGAELLLLCTNTMHKVADQIQAAVSIPLIHLADTTAAAIINAGLDTVGLLGTAFTMEQDFYRDRVARHGLRILVPGEVDRAAVHEIIYDELCLGIISERSRASYRAAINHLVEAGAEGIILGCTEIELLVADSDSPVPLFPTTRLHVEAAVAVSLEGLEIAPTLAGGRMRVLSTKDRSAADNHVGDYGDRALRQTLSRFSTSTIDIVGAGRNLAQARGPVIVERDGRTRLLVGHPSVLPDRKT